MTSRKRLLLALAAGLTLNLQGAMAQVQVQPLGGLDLFSAGDRTTGLGDDLWRGSSADIVRQVIPTLWSKPLSPASKRLALRVLATAATAPDGAGSDPALAAARAQALLALGDIKDANAAVERAPNMAASELLSQVAAEAALLSDHDERACAIGDALQSGRDGLYWLKLRAFCEAEAGQTGAAQLTLTLALAKTKDPVYARLMTALVAGAGDPGAPSERDGLEHALSRRLGLALAPPAGVVAPALVPTGVEPVDTIRAAIARGDLVSAQTARAGMVQDSIPGVTPTTLALLDALIAAASGQDAGPTLDRLVERGAVGGSKSAGQSGALLLGALGAPMGPDARAEFITFDLGRNAASVARLTALDRAAEAGLKGETAMLALATSADAGAAGPGVADRARIIQALRRAGLQADAQGFAIEGLMGLSFK